MKNERQAHIAICAAVESAVAAQRRMAGAFGCCGDCEQGDKPCPMPEVCWSQPPAAVDPVPAKSTPRLGLFGLLYVLTLCGAVLSVHVWAVWRAVA